MRVQCSRLLGACCFAQLALLAGAVQVKPSAKPRPGSAGALQGRADGGATEQGSESQEEVKPCLGGGWDG